jgi:hypothetical protein
MTNTNNSELLCCYGCGNPGTFVRNKKLYPDQYRCTENPVHCPAQKRKKQGSLDTTNSKKKQEKDEELAAILANPQPCACGKPGLVYGKRSKRWRCHQKQGKCTASADKRDATLFAEYGTSVVAHIPGVQAERSKTLKKNHANRSQADKTKISVKRSDTMEGRYGVRHSAHNPSSMVKRRQTNKERHGQEEALAVDSIRQKGIDSYKAKTGYDHWAKDPMVAAKKIATLMQNYNVEYPYQSEEIWATRSKTMIERYGVEHAIQNENIRDNTLRTVQERYGVDHVMQNAEIYKKAVDNAFKTKSYEMPSGSIVSVQGYEHYALDYLLSNGYKEIIVIIPTFSFILMIMSLR